MRTGTDGEEKTRPFGIRPLPFAIGLGVFLALLFLDSPLQHLGDWGSRPARAAAVAALMAIWWLTEAVSIYVTACLPLLFYPLLGVIGRGAAGDLVVAFKAYVDPYIFLFAGGMAIAAAMQHQQLHRRIALGIMDRIGTAPRRLLAGVLVATAFISLWISNTATAAMMLPIAMAVIAELEAELGGRRLSSYGMAVMLAVAYGANIGGIGTKIGTVPNTQLAGFLARQGQEVSFLAFSAVGLPFVLLLLPLAWLLLWRVGRADSMPERLGAGVVAEQLAKLGVVRPAERIVLAVFLAAAGLWIAGKPLASLVARWRPELGVTTAHLEAGTAVAAALALLLLRRSGRAVLPPRALRTVPWETLLLLGGGFALAAGIQGSGLSHWLAGQLGRVREMAPMVQIVAASLATVTLTAVASNTATTAVMLVVLKDAVAPGILTPVLFAATLAASCDFALPAGTPPNAIVFGSGYVTIPKMARTGAILDLAAALLAALWCWVAVPPLLG